MCIQLGDGQENANMFEVKEKYMKCSVIAKLPKC